MGRYKISEIARYREISPNGIVYLEKKGVLKSVRDENNGYRYYDEDAFATLGIINAYQQLDMSLDEARALYCSNLTDAMDALEQNRRKIEDAYLHKIRISERLQKNLEIIRQFNNHFEITQQPALWLLPISPPCPNDPEKKTMWKSWETLNNEWDRKIPFVQYAVYYEQPGSPDTVPLRCSIAEAEEAQALGLPDREHVIKLSPCRCVHTVFLLCDEDSMQKVRAILDYLDAHNLELCGPLIGRVLHFYMECNTLYSYTEFWAPVKESEKIPFPDSI